MEKKGSFLEYSLPLTIALGLTNRKKKPTACFVFHSDETVFRIIDTCESQAKSATEYLVSFFPSLTQDLQSRVLNLLVERPGLFTHELLFHAARAAVDIGAACPLDKRLLFERFEAQGTEAAGQRVSSRSGHTRLFFTRLSALSHWSFVPRSCLWIHASKCCWMCWSERPSLSGQRLRATARSCVL